VPRPRLLARLAEGVSRGVTVVCTPAGFGKTTVLANWARGSRRRAAWLSLDAGDNDPARFWRYVAAALARARPGIDAPVVALLRGPQQPLLEAVATAVINELTSVPSHGEVVLILDDYHLVEAPPVHESVAFLLDRLPPGLRLVLSSRTDPPLPLARLRARGQLAELRAADLRFTVAETAAFLREVTGLDLPVASVAALQDRTEGWAAGVQLAALSLRGHAGMRPQPPVRTPPSLDGFDATRNPPHAQFLATEHWSLLATRSMTWNEISSRTGTYLTVLSAAVIGPVAG
jgi:LuxR family maltose regulon positive regulatory protein